MEGSVCLIPVKSPDFADVDDDDDELKMMWKESSMAKLEVVSWRDWWKPRKPVSG
jgi:hypothetical protein